MLYNQGMRESLNQHLFNRHLEEEEEVVLVVHKHWWIGLKYMFWPTISILGLVLLLGVLVTREQSANTAYYVVALLNIVVLVWWFRNFFDYYLDAWIITNSGIVDVEWHGWFHRQSSRVLYSDIQGVSYEIDGVVNTLLRYGTISVEKVSTGNEISMDNVQNPRAIEAVILKHMEDYLHNKNLKDASTVQDILTSVIAREMQMRDFATDESTEE